MSLFPPLITTSSLRLSDVPVPAAALDEIHRFAHTFDRSELDPRQLNYAELITLSKETSLVELRARLYFEHRRWNHLGRPKDEQTVHGIRHVLGLIREKLESN